MFAKIDKLKVEIIEYYCEDELTFNLDEFLKIFCEFSNNANRVREVNKFILF
jgi:hypothetical protein